jgi:hypothetical protein
MFLVGFFSRALRTWFALRQAETMPRQKIYPVGNHSSNVHQPENRLKYLTLIVFDFKICAVRRRFARQRQSRRALCAIVHAAFKCRCGAELLFPSMMARESVK